jgi:hypothetical protein
LVPRFGNSGKRKTVGKKKTGNFGENFPDFQNSEFGKSLCIFGVFQNTLCAAGFTGKIKLKSV